MNKRYGNSTAAKKDLRADGYLRNPNFKHSSVSRLTLQKAREFYPAHEGLKATHTMLRPSDDPL